MAKVTEEHVEARRCFARQGLHRATMQDIFREAGLGPGAVYSYFEKLARAAQDGQAAGRRVSSPA
jgi:AcrR family transcriptional regulator